MYNGSGETAYYTCHHYDTTVSESRIATYLGIANGSIPPTALYGTHRTMPPGCDWALAGAAAHRASTARTTASRCGRACTPTPA